MELWRLIIKRKINSLELYIYLYLNDTLQRICKQIKNIEALKVYYLNITKRNRYNKTVEVIVKKPTSENIKQS